MSLAVRFGKGFFFVRGERKIKYSRVRFPGFSSFSEIMGFRIWSGVGLIQLLNLLVLLAGVAIP